MPTRGQPRTADTRAEAIKKGAVHGPNRGCAGRVRRALVREGESAESGGAGTRAAPGRRPPAPGRQPAGSAPVAGDRAGIRSRHAARPAHRAAGARLMPMLGRITFVLGAVAVTLLAV